MIEYVFESWLWSVLGLVVGFMFGRMERKLHEIWRFTVEVDDKGVRDRPQPVEASPPPKVGDPPMSRLVGILLLVLALGSGIQALYFEQKRAAQAECVRENFVQFHDAVAERSRLGLEDRNLINDVIVGVAESRAIKDEAKRDAMTKRVLQEYVRERSELLQERASVPLPDVPQGECE